MGSGNLLRLTSSISIVAYGSVLLDEMTFPSITLAQGVKELTLQRSPSRCFQSLSRTSVVVITAPASFQQYNPRTAAHTAGCPGAVSAPPAVPFPQPTSVDRPPTAASRQQAADYTLLLRVTVRPSQWQGTLFLLGNAPIDSHRKYD